MATKKKAVARPKSSATGFVHCGFTSPDFVQCSLPVDHPVDLQHRFNGLPDAEFIQLTLAQDVPLEVMLSIGDRRDDGVLAQLSRSELQLVAPETIDLEMSKDEIMNIARFHLQRAWKVKHSATDEELTKLDDTARYWIIFNIKTKLAALAATASKKEQRRNTMTAEDNVTLETVTGTAGKKGKKTAKKAAKAPAKVAAKKAAAADQPRAEVYDTMVVATSKETKEGTFFAQVQKFAAKPIKLETLIKKLVDEVELRSAKDPEGVIRVRTRDSFTRLGFLKAAKA